jgi:hypothetical protein
MYNGSPPERFQVHHKKPREFGGGNEDGNLMLVQSEAPHLHSQLTAHQGKVSNGMSVGQSRTVEFPMFEGKYFASTRGVL